MGVLTGFWRVPPELFERPRSDPKLVELLRVEGEVDGFTPASVDVDKAWDDILQVLSHTGPQAAHAALDGELEDVNGMDVGFYTADMVCGGAAALQDVRIEEIRERALSDGELRTYRGDPIAYLLDYIRAHLGTVVDFWREASAAGEAILSETS